MSDSLAGTAAALHRCRPRPSGRRRLPGLRAYLLGLVLAVLVPALGVAGAAAWNLASSYRHAFEARLQDTAQALALYLDSELRVQLAAVSALASSPLLELDDLSAFGDWAGKVSGSVGGWVVVNDAAPGHRQLLNTALPAGAPLPPPSRPGEGAWDVIRRAVETRQPVVSDFFVGRGTGRPLVAVAAPASRQGQVSRVVVLAMDPGRLSQQLRTMRSSGGAFVSVADGQGRIVARSRDHERFLGVVPPSRSVPEVERERGLFRSQSVYGEDALYAARRLHAAPGWTVAVAEPYASYRASWLVPLAVLVGGGVVALALGLAIAARLARQVLRPVEALVQRAESVAEAGSGRMQPSLMTTGAGVAEFETLRAASERAEESLAAREAEFRAIFETAAAGVAEIDAQTRRYLRVNRRFCEISGRSETELVEGLSPEDVIHVEDRNRIPSTISLEHGETAEGELRLVRSDGTVVWLRVSAGVSVRDAEGRPLRVVSVVQDVTGRRQAEEARTLLAREVDHRAKNVLAVVQAALRLTPKHDAAAYARAVEGRVSALARAHTLLADAQWVGADLHSLAEAELKAFLSARDGEPGNAPIASLKGPPVLLSPAATQPFSVVLHELATNATKHGALSLPGGQVKLAWRIDEAAGQMRLCWMERGGPPVPGPPERQGFGSRFVEATVLDQLGGAIRRSWDPAGLVCEIEVPVSRALAGAS
ncbi:PAS domain S-box protein [Belnapia sp. T18]|uniref:histidine kinase n=1 Tax=Belnapia arida TaxID=2804533 RepID=A0ABS1U5Y4_9PROT|nr:PAS domain S-box protein [Belnapia arida]MBL6080084.1 PAS domain S-box protein [Belnapia arida]